MTRVEALKKWSEKMASGHFPDVSHETQLVPVAPGENLEVLDFGGQGEPLVCLVGLLLTAHSYDDFAPALTDRFHVYAITRRGFGASSQPETGYDIRTRIEDLSHALEAMGLDRVCLVGHSQAGDELTWFAETYPEGVSRLVYLDAAEDHSWFWGWFKSNGFGSYASVPETAMRVWEESARAGAPDYRRLNAPALAIYARWEHAADVWPDAWEMADEMGREWIRKAFDSWRVVRTRSKADFAEALDGRIVELSRAGHMIFVTDREDVLDLTRHFIEHV